MAGHRVTQMNSSEDKGKAELVCDVKLTDQDNREDIPYTDTSLLDQCESYVSSIQVKSDNVSLDEEVVQSKNNTKVPDIENVSVKTSGIGSDSENNTTPLSPGIHHIRSNSSGSHQLFLCLQMIAQHVIQPDFPVHLGSLTVRYVNE
jgi:hypothetical protein